jgi:hypothetical protein
MVIITVLVRFCGDRHPPVLTTIFAEIAPAGMTTGLAWMV